MTCECRVSVDEIAAAMYDPLGLEPRLIRMKLTGLGYRLEPDWAGRDSLPIAKMPSVYARLIGDHRAYEAAERKRKEREEQADRSFADKVRAAFAGPYEAMLRAGKGWPMAHSAGVAAAHKAAAEVAESVEETEEVEVAA